MASRIRNIVRNIRTRLHALVVLLIVAWAGYAAVDYLVRYVFEPTRVPPQYSHTIMELNADALRDNTLPETISNLRAPMGHYHHVDQWFEPDNFNGCATSGCHSPMPHQKIPAVRSFDNFHATFLACQMCHEYPENNQIALQWINITTGEKQPTPSLLKLINYLEDNHEAIQNKPSEAHLAITDLLTEVLQVSHHDPVLEYLLAQLTTSQPDSPTWRHAVSQLTVELPLHARGEYGAKLYPADANGQVADAYKKRFNAMIQLSKEYFNESPDSPQREKVNEKIHAGLAQEPLRCLSCHNPEQGLIDFKELGYTKNRAEFLQGLPIAGQLQKIQQGQHFYIKTHLGVSP